MDIICPELRTRRRKRRIVVAVARLTVFAVTLDPVLPEVARASTWVGTVERGSFKREVRGPGTLVPKVIRWIPAASGGRVERIVSKPGVRVEPETVLVEMSNADLVQQLEEARWDAEAAVADRASLVAELDREVLEAQAGLAALRADAKSERLQADAEKTPSERGIVSVIQYRRSELRAGQLEARVRFEEQRFERLRASHEARVAAEDARIGQI
ncbi:MAG: hypothetical protein RQ847_00060 [Wenzhouxiangellaceae bacterium]|nr:hypothetical protein [Wenzhouxiangellaceae bacterium]